MEAKMNRWYFEAAMERRIPNLNSSYITFVVRPS